MTTASTLTDWVCAAVIAGALLAPTACSGPEDHSGDYTEAAEVQQAAEEAASAQRRERAAAAVCAHDLGANSAHRWISDTEITCHDKRGRTLARTQVQL